MANHLRLDCSVGRCRRGASSASWWILPVPAFVFFITLVAIVSTTATAKADSDTPPTGTLKVKPDKCISLSQGLICYQRVRFEWSLQEAGDYCLFEESTDKPLNCWTQLQSGTYLTEFASRKSKTYYLVNQESKQKLASATVQMAWVYRNKKRSRGRWRLF